MPPSSVRIGLLGCGVVGQGLLKLLRERERLIRDSVGAPIQVSRVAVRDPGKRRECELTGIQVGTDPMAVATAPDVDLLVELAGGEPMLEPVRSALRRGIPVVTANKHILTLHGEDLERLAGGSKTTIRCEASAAGGVPRLPAARPRPTSQEHPAPG